MSKLNVTGNDLLSFSQAVKGKLDTKQGNLTPGFGIAIDNDGTIRVTIDHTIAVVLAELPEANEANYLLYKDKLVLVPDEETPEQNNKFIEYVISRRTVSDVVTYFWEKVGEQHWDLDNYYNKAQTDAKLALKADKTDFYKAQNTLKAGQDLLDLTTEQTLNPVPVTDALLAFFAGMDIDDTVAYSMEAHLIANPSTEAGLLSNAMYGFCSALATIARKYSDINTNTKNILVKYVNSDGASALNGNMGILALSLKGDADASQDHTAKYRVSFLSSETMEMMGGCILFDDLSWVEISGSEEVQADVYRLSAPCQSISASELATIIAALS